MKHNVMLLGVGILMLCSMAYAAVPQLINFQGILRDGSGIPVADGSYSVQFTIYDAASAGNVIWTETQSVTTSGGLFTALLGDSTPVPDSAFNDSSRWLGIQVGADPEMTPRQRLVSGAYSLRVAHFIPDFGIFNTFIGQNAGNLTMTGNFNAVSGAFALSSNTSGYSNTGSGAFALSSNTTGYQNTASGVSALSSNTIGYSNTASGAFALSNNTEGNSNTASGNFALFSNTSGYNNTASGYATLYSNSAGNFNTASGVDALHNNTVGSANTASGASALYSNIGYSNTASGAFALYSNTEGSFNTASGWGALYSNTTGNNNTASGVSALYSNTAGYSNTASGYATLYSNSTGNFNTASGDSALYSNTTGYNNTASGNQALRSNTTGFENTASGYQALYNNTGNDNTASGSFALYNNTTGFRNTASGDNALFSNTTGSSNTAIGHFANVSVGDLTNATAIGNGALVNASNKIRLGNAAVTVIEGQVAYTFTSDKNQKENFRPVDGEEVLQKIRGFNLTSWNYKGHDPKEFRHYGPMAQDFFAAFGDDGVGKIGTETTLNSGDVAGILMIAVQALGNENAELKIRMEQLEKKLKELQAEKPQAEVR